MTDREREIFRTDRPVDVQGLGDYMNGMPLDLNSYNTGKPKGIMFKHASSPAFQRLHDAIRKLAAYTSVSDRAAYAADEVDNTAKPKDTTRNTLANIPPFAMMNDNRKMQTQETVKLSGGQPIVKDV